MTQHEAASKEAQTITGALRHIVETRPEAITDADKLQSLLSDHCPDQAPEVNRLVCAIREGVPEAIGDASDVAPRNAILEPLASRLSHSAGLAPEAAMWAVETWYEVLIGMPDNTGDATSTKLPVATRDFCHRATRDLFKGGQTRATDRLKAAIRAELLTGRSYREVLGDVAVRGARMDYASSSAARQVLRQPAMTDGMSWRYSCRCIDDQEFASNENSGQLA